MGCKAAYENVKESLREGFILTIWDVKNNVSNITVSGHGGFILTIWDVKVYLCNYSFF
ncbi:hypothetical protein L21TH_0101 [Caldisalinibacter kiritimatiensis]|uniref:Uncharacterized protein n=1 Tax=Caldisalinibacter kiritimatiensis TaxID=1304284 RepID=R1CZ23_9FIRM|nr:hypothetical protein L21TH_0101 [Caldisalinibacter kiritimatiensis]